jgi:hypothetical protein
VHPWNSLFTGCESRTPVNSELQTYHHSRVRKSAFYIKNGKFSQALVAHAYNPSYSGGKDQEDHSSKPAPGK